MAKNIPVALFFIIALGCGQNTAEWNPIFENTNFDYLKRYVEQSLQVVGELDETTRDIAQTADQEKLAQVRKKLLELKDYYIPLTTIRQKIYDAERYYKLNQIKPSEKLLNEAKAIMTSLDALTESAVFDTVIADLDSMIDSVVASLDDRSKETTYHKLKALGQHINLMLEKGELVLSGVAFDK